MQRYCICLAFERGGVKDIGLVFDGNKSLYLVFVGVIFFSASWTAFRAVRTASWTVF
jgi:hypothetical protein